MANRTPSQRAARHLQRLTGWNYQECLRLMRSRMTPEAVEALAKMRGAALNHEDPQYALWRKRADRRSGGTDIDTDEKTP